jgi:hypothetical protein
MIVFESSLAKILIIVLFLKIMLLMYFDVFLFLNFFLASFRPPSKLPWHTSVPSYTGSNP